MALGVPVICHPGVKEPEDMRGEMGEEGTETCPVGILVSWVN